MVKGFLYVIVSTILLLVALMIFVWEYGSPVPRTSLSELHITEDSSVHPVVVRADGRIMSSGLAVTSAKPHQEGRCIVIVVRQGIIHQNRHSGSFHPEIPVPDDVNEIAYGNRHEVVWRR